MFGSTVRCSVLGDEHNIGRFEVRSVHVFIVRSIRSSVFRGSFQHYLIRNKYLINQHPLRENESKKSESIFLVPHTCSHFKSKLRQPVAFILLFCHIALKLRHDNATGHIIVSENQPKINRQFGPL